jgi:hypothetical protein
MGDIIYVSMLIIQNSCEVFVFQRSDYVFVYPHPD